MSGWGKSSESKRRQGAASSLRESKTPVSLSLLADGGSSMESKLRGGSESKKSSEMSQYMSVSPTEKYKWDMSSPAFDISGDGKMYSQGSPKFNPGRRYREKLQAKKVRGAQVEAWKEVKGGEETKELSFALEMKEASNSSSCPIEPKVFVPNVVRHGEVPRRVAVERLKQLYASLDINDLLEEAGVLKEVQMEYAKQGEHIPTNDGLSLDQLLPLNIFDNQDYDMYTPE